MYLKSIEVHGFKSFANKINFQFHNGITGIVGPNGSGKSNVADAVRWVLGEQRIKQLRGASMQDVIFSGTEMRKPMGYAYVAITLDNRDHQLAIDYDEVTVARRLYRSGESEYLINGTACRLKDVNELFYDTGIGKEGYSIIGQGQIEKILSGKPEERRELFDEAAGIVKFKRRKAAAQKKLEDEKQNLLRVSDILSELEKQIGPLEKQSEKAKIYLKKKEELKTLDVNVFLLENGRLKGQLDETIEKYKIASNDLEETTNRYNHIKEEYEQVQAEIESLEEVIDTTRNASNDANLLRGNLTNEVKILEEQINSAESNEGHMNKRKSSVQEQIDAKNTEKQAILDDKKITDDNLSDLVAKREEAKALLLSVQNRIEELNNQIEVGKNTIIEELNKRATIKSKLGRYDSMMEQIGIRKAELNARLLRVKSDEENQVETIKNLESAFEDVNKEIRSMDLKQKDMEKTLEEIRKGLSDKDNKLRENQVLYHSENSTLEALQNLTERYEGYGGSVKKVMEQKGNTKGIIGVVADIIKVEKKYETAIEIALGGNIQNIVTEDESTAKEMIQFLKQNKSGRATFLPLTSITKPQEFKTPEVLDEKGVIGMANELVSIEEKYKNVAKAMLGRIVVVDNIDNAVKIAKKFDYGVRMVTIEGELLVPGGAISGGAFKNNSNLLSRRREIEELTKRVKNLLSENEQLEKEIQEDKEKRNKLRLELEQLKTALQAKFIEQNTARLNLISAKQKMDETKEGGMALKAEEADIERQVQDIKVSKEKISGELKMSEELEVSVNEQITSFQVELEEKRTEETEKTAKVSEWDVEVEKVRQQQEFKQLNVDRIEGEILRFEAEMREILEGIELSQEEIQRKRESIAQIEETIKASYVSEGENQQKLTEAIQRKEELSNKQKTFFTDRESLSERMSALDKEVFRLNAQKEKCEEALETHINYMWDEYEITLSDAAALKDPEMNDLPAMKKSISTLKDEIKKLGDVNVNAIEDYKAVSERYTFLKAQHDDLVEAEKTLNGIIVELDAAMRKQFTEKFADIKREFDKVFKELFGGGKGTLELIEEEDILEAGIRIIAQPPGKKLQNMMQLSGGEKALTAIALLFAIQNLKPSPFCLLDEIEAALDESNVGRFAKYLHKLTKNTQFIVITHRRGTMEKADRLYGITMQEKGVSALVSVDLIEKDLDD